MVRKGRKTSRTENVGSDENQKIFFSRKRVGREKEPHIGRIRKEVPDIGSGFILHKSRRRFTASDYNNINNNVEPTSTGFAHQ